MNKLDLHGIRHTDVDRLVENFVLLKEKPIREAYERGKSEGAVSLKRAQFDTAVAGNTAMLIWLGKNRLGQADKIESKNETEITSTGALDKLNNSIARIIERKSKE